METQIIDGKALAIEYQEKIKTQVAKMNRTPTLAVILVGNDPASEIYVRHKRQVAERVGIISELFQLSPITTEEALIAFIQELNANDKVDGILVQLPLPKHINADAVIEAIDPNKDADGLTSANLGHLFVGTPNLVPCTPMACLALIKTVCPILQGKNVVIVGRSKLVGKPLSQLLLDENCTVTQAHSKTVNLKKVCREADILIVAVGKPNLITKSFVKKGTIIIDVGINRLKNKKIVGDVEFDKMIGHVSAITPVPGGVGPMTVTMLLQNTVQIAQKRQKNN
ncbi:MAG: bifunctional methylenetetrahydrofolate dehydrogenase/methenyltetrahydrofolate cyclohydrolase FolD [Alphaproteobacteria bacterium]|nr:bifunctional methylenetetrahydrofolate dehydrogenase/methenyltetrahydrofolate cyclohydrolase FolD [Alphaproteobacteria bacterium]